MAESMLAALTAYYRDQGILSTHFICPLKAVCEGDCTTFTGPKSAFVSTGYERHDLPRLLFLSLDSGDGIHDPRHGLPESARKWEDNRDIDKCPKNRHWYLTHELAWHILKCFDPNLELSEVNRHFAHANSAKCCMNNPGQGQAHPRLFTNCRKYIPGEMRVLCPDVLVTQGARAKESVRICYPAIEPRDEWTAIMEMDGRQVFWLHHHHPRYGGFWTHRDDGRGWEKHALQIREFAEQQGWPGT